MLNISMIKIRKGASHHDGTGHTYVDNTYMLGTNDEHYEIMWANKAPYVGL